MLFQYTLAIVALISALEIPAQNKKLRVALLSGSLEYNSDVTLKKYAEHLEKEGIADTDWLQGKDKQSLTIPGLDALDSADVLIVLARRMTLPSAQVKKFQDFAKSGKAIIGLRSASHAFQDWLDFDRDVLGGSYDGHESDKPFTIKFPEAALGHPILKGVKPWVSRKVYKNAMVATGAVTLAEAKGPDSGDLYHIAWYRDREQGRVFSTTLGVQQDFDKADFITMLDNAVKWTAKWQPPVGLETPSPADNRKEFSRAVRLGRFPANFSSILPGYGVDGRARASAPRFPMPYCF